MNVTLVEIAQAISRTIDEVQEDELNLQGGLFIDPNEQSPDERRVVEVGAELLHRTGAEAFEIRTSTGQVFQILVTEVSPGHSESF